MGIRPDELDHAMRMLRCTIRGYAMLQAADGFQWSNDPDESVAWMIRFFDAGLTAVGKTPPLWLSAGGGLRLYASTTDA
jgi:hypothetical protein